MQTTGLIKLFVTFYLKVIMLDLTQDEKSFLITTLKGDYVWNSNMAREYPAISAFTERKEKINSILTKLGHHPFKTLLENNSKS